MGNDPGDSNKKEPSKLVAANGAKANTKPTKTTTSPKDDAPKPDQKDVQVAGDEAVSQAVDIKTLQARIEEQDLEIIKLMKMLQVYVGGEGQNLREAKILELSKRNRDLNLALEKERRCSSKWKHQLQIVKEELLKKIEEEERGNSDVNKSEKEAKETQEWKEKYNQTNAKLLEIQASRAILSAEVSKLQHALHREVGDHIPISKMGQGE